MKKFFVLMILLMGCAAKVQNSNDLSSIQILDRNGFSETISAKERLGIFDKTDFLNPQPYQKVVRVYGKSSQGKTSSKITTYHSNGQLWQYLEVENGRARGKFNEWHSNGQLKVDASVIEGSPDLSEMAQLTWFFEGINHVYDEQGHLIAKINYEKGLLEGISHYFHPSGALSKEIPYTKDQIHGVVQIWDEKGFCIEKTDYIEDEKHGLSIGYWNPHQMKFQETYEKGLLQQAEYFNPSGELVAKIENGDGIQALFKKESLFSLIEYRQGIIEGKVDIFNEKGELISRYHIKDTMKEGEEWEYYPSIDKNPQPKLYLTWKNDSIQGVSKTWYENGVIESQREIHDNKKHGQSFAWYQDGELMLVEDYETDLLMKGLYYKKWEKKPISRIEDGKGIATLFDKDGKFLKKVPYEKGIPSNN